MKPNRNRIVLFVFVLALCVGAESAHSLVPAHFWSQPYGSTGADYGYAIATDAAGNAFVTGYFSGTVSIGGFNLVSAGGLDIFIAKFSPTGVIQWAVRFGSTSSDLGRGIATDASGNVFVTGFFSGTVSFGGGNLVSAGGSDIFVAKFNGTGAHQWSQRFGGTGSDTGYSLATDAGGNVAVTGNFFGTANFGGADLVSAGGSDIFIAEYHATGVHLWSRRAGSAGTEFGFAVAADAPGNVFVAGYFTGTVNFGGADLVSAGGSDIYVAKYNAAGVHQWSQRYGSPFTDSGYAVVTDASGDVVVTGNFGGIVDFGGGNLTGVGGSDIFVVKFSPTGAHQWSQRFGGISNDDGRAVAVDGSGNVVVAGIFQGTANFGGVNLVSAGAEDIFIAKYSATGVHRWSRRCGGTTTDNAFSVAAGTSDHVFMTGTFQDTVDFGGGGLVSVGLEDFFVASYLPEFAEPVITSISDIGNDQGRKVKIRFARSAWDDATIPNPITRYVAFLKDDAPAVAALRGDRTAPDNGWTEVGSVGAFVDNSYGIDVPTNQDSTVATGQHYSTFFIRAMTAVPTRYYDSPPDSGYSLDNLAPAVPPDFAFAAGQLTWGESSAPDFDFFTVYGSNSDSFASATVVNYAKSPAIDVNGSPYTFYFVTATDVSGNESRPARVEASGEGGTPESYVLSVSNYPNPFNPRTTISYTVPSRGAVNISIYDAGGARIAILMNEGNHAAGAYSVEWDGRADGGGRVSSGIYFARIEHNGATRSKKMVVLK